MDNAILSNEDTVKDYIGTGKKIDEIVDKISHIRTDTFVTVESLSTITNIIHNLSIEAKQLDGVLEKFKT